MILLKTSQSIFPLPPPLKKRKVMPKLFLKFPHLEGWYPEARGGTSRQEPACQCSAAVHGLHRVRPTELLN